MWNTGLFKLVSIPVLALSIFYFIRQNNLKRNEFYLVLFFAVSILLLNFSSNGVVLFANTSLFLIVSFLLISYRAKIKAYDVFYKLFTLSLIPGLVIFVLSFFGFDLPWERLESTNDSKTALGLFYRNYLGSVVLSNQIFSTGMGEIYRFSAIYDEPGVVGTVAALLLASNRFKLDTISSKIILISGVISFSLAFYVLAGVYVLLKTPVLLIKVLMPVLILVFIFYGELKENSLISHYLFDRIEQGFDDPKSVDNRVSTCFKNEFDGYIKSGNFFIGNGAGAHSDTGCNVSSYLSIIYNHGFLGFSLIIIFYTLLYLILSPNLKFLYMYPFILVFALSLYQRPAFFSTWMIVIFAAAVLNENRVNNMLLDSKIRKRAIGRSVDTPGTV